MKYIKVSKINSTLIGDDLAKELFISILECYLEGDRDEEIEIDFKDVILIDPTFLNSFILLFIESNQLTFSKLKTQIIFSGLYVEDIKNLTKALSIFNDAGLDKKDIEAIRKQLRDMHDKRQKELWGNSPVIKNAFNKVSDALDKILDKAENISK